MKLDKALVVLDLETTGTWIEKDKIIEIGLVKLTLDGQQESYVKRVNPGISIPPVVTELTGISDEDVNEAPFFRDIAEEVEAFLQECDLAGFNLERFDLPLLEREFFECGRKFAWQARTVYDAQKVYHLNEKRDLSAAYKFYCQKPLSLAHTALADAEATLEIIKKQVECYGKGSDELSCLSEFSYRTLSEFYDSGRKFRWWNKELYPMFGNTPKEQV